MMQIISLSLNRKGKKLGEQMCEAEYSVSTETYLLFWEANTHLGCMICNFVCGNTQFGFAFIYIFLETPSPQKSLIMELLQLKENWFICSTIINWGFTMRRICSECWPIQRWMWHIHSCCRSKESQRMKFSSEDQCSSLFQTYCTGPYLEYKYNKLPIDLQELKNARER